MSIPVGTAHNQTISKLDNLISVNQVKPFVLNTASFEPISGAVDDTVSKNYTIIGGIDNTTASGQLTPVQVSSEGVLSVAVSNQEAMTDVAIKGRSDIADPTTETFLKCSATGILDVNLTTASLATETTLSSLNDKSSKGDGFIASGVGGLQQMLMYAKHADGRLFPLESDGDRLRVVNGDVSTFAQQSGNTMTQSKLYQAMGTNGTNMRTLKTNDFGVLQTNSIAIKDTTIYTNQALTGDTFWTTELDCTASSKLQIVINSSATSILTIYGGAVSAGQKVPIQSLYPVNETIVGGTANIATLTLECPPNFIGIGNPDAGGVDLEIMVTKY